MVFAFLTLEAYVNYIGVKVCPKFVDRPYLKFEEKLREVMQRLGLSEPDRSVRPYRTVWDLKDLRDEIAHGKHLKFRGVYKHYVSEQLPVLQGFVEDRVTRRGTVRAVRDVRRFIRFIHEGAKVKFPDDEALRLPLFGGILDMTLRETTPVTGP